MPRAEIGTTKHLANKMKAKGLQRLRYYCQVCERQMRDENGFKCHTQSESHVRQMLLIGEDPRKHINDYSTQFQRDFLTLLRTSHGEKKIDANRFYQEYIANKQHIHMNATKWVTLSEFVKHLGRQGICRVEEGERGFTISWIDNSPEALRRQEAVKRKERMDRGDELREQKLIEEQVRKAHLEAAGSGKVPNNNEKILQRTSDEKVRLLFRTSDSGHEDAAASGTLRMAGTADVLTNEIGKHKLKASSMGKERKSIFAGMGKKLKTVPDNTEHKRPATEIERIMREDIEEGRMRNDGRFKRLRLD